MISLNKLLIITIGESPRHDITPLLNKYLNNIEIIQKGILDNLKDKEMMEITDTSGTRKTLVTRKRNGESVFLNGEIVEQRVEDTILEESARGYENILVLCTGEFSNIERVDSNVFFPDLIISPLISSMFPHKKMGLLIPDEKQKDMMKSKWGKHGVRLNIKSASPYENISEIISSCEELESLGSDFILLDCMGYTEDMKERVKDKVKVPVILSNALLVKLITEVM